MEPNSLCALKTLCKPKGSTAIHIHTLEIGTVNVGNCPNGSIDPEGPTNPGGPDGPGVGVQEPCKCIAREDPSDPD
jgi:hypothetical protein